MRRNWNMSRTHGERRVVCGFFCSIILAFSLYTSRLWRHTILSSSCLPSRHEVGLDGSTPAPPPTNLAHCESTKEIKRVKTREARTKESAHLKRQKENPQKRTQYQERAGHYSACSSPSPISTTYASSSLSFRHG